MSDPLSDIGRRPPSEALCTTTYDSTDDDFSDVAAVSDELSDTEPTKEYLYSQRYYFDFVVFEVQGVCYRVPQYRFIADSAKFATLYALPKGDDSDEPGSSEINPIFLSELKAIDFERFLEILYPLETPVKLDRSLEEWTSVLKLATEWSFYSIRDSVIGYMEQVVKPIDSVSKISLGMEYGVAHWFVKGFHELVIRPEKVSLEESTQLGLRWAWIILSHREERWENHSRSNLGQRAGLCTQPDDASLRKALQPELEEMKKLQADSGAHDIGGGGVGAVSVNDILAPLQPEVSKPPVADPCGNKDVPIPPPEAMALESGVQAITTAVAVYSAVAGKKKKKKK